MLTKLDATPPRIGNLMKSQVMTEVTVITARKKAMIGIDVTSVKKMKRQNKVKEMAGEDTIIHMHA